jgi:hypothetical protein
VSTIELDLKAIRVLLGILVLADNKPLRFVLDGFQAIDTPETRPYLQRVVDLLREHGTKSVVKVVFTTNGVCEALLGTMASDERVTSEKLVEAGPCLPGYRAVPTFESYTREVIEPYLGDGYWKVFNPN